MRPIIILLVTSTATVICTWFTVKFHLGFLTAWVLATALIFAGAFLSRMKSS